MTTTNTETGAIGSLDDARAREVLEDFVFQNADLQQLELLLKKFNLFEALNLWPYEVRHSKFLAYLLDPQQNHGLGDLFLKAFLQSAVKGKTCCVTPIDIDVWNLGEAEVYREWRNIDIFVRDERNRFAIIIENKISSEEHSDQLARYYAIASRELIDWRILPLFLTVDASSASDAKWFAFGYDRVCAVVEDILKRNTSIGSDVRLLMEHYAEILRRRILSESEISELCRRIYAKHKQALDLIYEYRPDRQQLVRETVEQLIQGNAALELDESTKTYIHFIPKKMDLPLLRQCTGWTKSHRILMFEAVNEPTDLSIKLYIGPGVITVRQKLLDFASQHQPPFKTSSRGGTQWSTIFNRVLLNSKAYELHGDEFVAKLKQQWNEFIEKDLPTIVSVIAGEEWLQKVPEQPEQVQST